jgi:misacylated tRNA(Ala) deacylase
MAAAVAGPIPSIVGALSCQKDSYLQSLETEVVSCIEYEPPKAPQTKGKSKSKKPAEADKTIKQDAAAPSKTWLIEFADSVLFPEGLFPFQHLAILFS